MSRAIEVLWLRRLLYTASASCVAGMPPTTGRVFVHRRASSI